MTNHSLRFNVDVIVYPCPNPDAGLAKLCQLTGSPESATNVFKIIKCHENTNV